MKLHPQPTNKRKKKQSPESKTVCCQSLVPFPELLPNINSIPGWNSALALDLIIVHVGPTNKGRWGKLNVNAILKGFSHWFLLPSSLVSICPFILAILHLFQMHRDGDRSWQLLIFNQEFLVSASHQLVLITSLPFVHTARSPHFDLFPFQSRVTVRRLITWQSCSASQIIISPQMAPSRSQGAMPLKMDPKIRKRRDLPGFKPNPEKNPRGWSNRRSKNPDVKPKGEPKP